MDPRCAVLVFAVPLTFAACGSGSRGELPPAGLAARPAATSLLLTWSDGSGRETGFAIERAEGDSRFQRVGQVAQDVTRFTDRGLRPSTTYRYRVYALLPFGNQVGSAVLAVTTLAPQVQGLEPASAFVVGESRVQVLGDGFDAGVDRVVFGGAPATGLRVISPTVAECAVPARATVGTASVTVDLPSGTHRLADAFRFVAWPPTWPGQPDDVRRPPAPTVEDLQMVAAGATTVLVWTELRSRRAVFAARQLAGQTWSAPVRLSAETAQTWQPHAAMHGDLVAVVWVDLGRLWLTRSDDGGRSWAEPRPVPAAVGGVFHPRVAVAGAQIHLAWTDERPYQGEVYYTRSTDGGRSFPPEPERVNGFLGARDLQLAVRDGCVHLMWRYTGGAGALVYRRSTDGGARFGELEQRLALQPGVQPASAPQLAVSDTAVYVVSQEGGDRRIALQRSLDRGATWQARQLLDHGDLPSSRPRIALTPGGAEVYVVWHEAAPTARVELNRSLDHGATFLAFPVRVAQAPNPVQSRPEVACNGGVVVVTFVAEPSGPGSQVYVIGSAEWGTRWQPAPHRLSLQQGLTPYVRCHGGRLLLAWLGLDPVQQSYAVRSIANTWR